ncbi:acyl-CoA dehydrogenase NM domain-like protein [Gloeophyllum trabeum ATCC 11539]|uniref:Acyl-CoA dehydrogenase NM domain-like protein n=1 Tax=Gloeophyllum trabeum (strain ATCC 11539 / FP-39264 / Madison 617) TaxID=670483 RepID=S7QA90_GLOTA|nr:acyl-CoA dehydrogenase NM domain-like protein [Gloeophyllum trabeum ATCC 11539]EPQ56831.1 acyl-CoA dehydrogenase NM domain-like protein [Gloeophyllum trabeum ATCC 11539]
MPGLSVEDIQSLSPKFWKLHTDPILCADGAATTLLTIQYNLVVGTLTALGAGREDITKLIEDLMTFKTLGQFCLTEVGHGLDAASLETTATLLPDGSFELHTPSEKAAKFMPPTIPVLGRPCVGIVYAQLVVAGVRKGIRAFLLNLNDGHHMSPGISARLLSPRHGSSPVNHSITSFHSVKVPASALLGEFDAYGSDRMGFLLSLWRVGVGALALSSVLLPAIQLSTYIAGKYSLRRTVNDTFGTRVPIITFTTQHIPVLTALAHSFVLKSFHEYAIKHFIDGSMDYRVRHGVAACFKAVMLRACHRSLLTLSDRCGAQGLFGHNRIASYFDEMRGIGIAEGDVLVLSIRLASEILINRYSLPGPVFGDGLLCKYEMCIFEHFRSITSSFGHRSPEFASLVLPNCLNMTEAIGHRMAYEAAVAQGVPQELVQIFAHDAVKDNLAWYAEHGYLTVEEFGRSTATIFSSALPKLKSWIEELQVAPYVSAAPIVSDESWSVFVAQLDNYTDSSRGRARALL